MAKIQRGARRPTLVLSIWRSVGGPIGLGRDLAEAVARTAQEMHAPVGGAQLQIVNALTGHSSFEIPAIDSGDLEGRLALRHCRWTQGAKVRHDCREFRIGQRDGRHAAARQTGTDGGGELRIGGGRHSRNNTAGELAAIGVPAVTHAAARLEKFPPIGRILGVGGADPNQDSCQEETAHGRSNMYTSLPV